MDSGFRRNLNCAPLKADQSSSIERLEVMEVLSVRTIQHGSHGHVQLLGTSSVASVAEELNFKCYLILINYDI